MDESTFRRIGKRDKWECYRDRPEEVLLQAVKGQAIQPLLEQFRPDWLATVNGKYWFGKDPEPRLKNRKNKFIHQVEKKAPGCTIIK